VHTKFISFISVLSLLLLVASLKAGEESSLEHIKAATQSMDLMTFEEARGEGEEGLVRCTGLYLKPNYILELKSVTQVNGSRVRDANNGYLTIRIRLHRNIVIVPKGIPDVELNFPIDFVIPDFSFVRDP